MNATPELRERLRLIFLEEMSDHLEVLETGTGGLAGGETADPRTVAEMFRAAHSLKGAAAAVGASAVAARCHELEEFLAALRDGREPRPENLREDLGRLVEAVSAAGQRWRGAVLPADRTAGGEKSASPEQPATLRRSTVRVPADVLDTVVAQAADLVTVAHRSDGLAAALTGMAQDVSTSASDLRRDLRSLRFATGGPPTSTQLSQVLERLDARLDRLRVRAERLSRTATADVHELWSVARALSVSTQAARAVPFADATAGLAQVVRNASEQSGKHARLVVDAAQVSLDKDLVAVVQTVLGHLVRNAVDHGLEPVAERRRLGKDTVGLVRVTARLRGDGLELVVADDGGGLRVDLLRAAARRSGRPVDDTAGEMLAFEPGVTTATRVTDASGRGVGLDAVRSAVESLGGSVRLTSAPGSGVEVLAVLPLTTSTLRVVLVKAGGRVVALPSVAVGRVLTVQDERAGGRDTAPDMVTVDDDAVAVVRLRDALGWESEASEQRTGAAVVLLLHVPEPVAVLVEEVVDEREVVLTASPARLSGVEVLLGTARHEDGSLLLVLSPAACVRAARGRRGQADGSPTVDQRELPGARVLVVEDTITTRELERGILEAAGYTVLVADDGLRAWQLLRDTAVDAVVSDVMMPRMDGLALCRAVRGSAELAHLPVVLVSSLDGEADRMAAAEAGANAYLTKQEFDRDELLATLRRVL